MDQSKVNPRRRPVRTTPTDNPKHEALAQCLARGMTHVAAYVGAGYSEKGAAAGVSSLLKTNPWIKERAKKIQEGERTAFSRVRPDLVPVATYTALGALSISKQTILKELWDNAMLGKNGIIVGNEGQLSVNLSASNAALVLIGKELGMFTGKPAPDETEVYDVSEFDEEKLEALEKLLTTSSKPVY